MKKTLRSLLLLAALMVPWAASAQETLTVGETPDTTYHRFPIWGIFSDYGYISESIYPADLIDEMTSGTITGLTFYLSTTVPDQFGETFELRLTEVDNNIHPATAFLGNDGDLVWTGTVNCSNNLLVLEFDEPYTYQGGNLLMNMRSLGGSGCPQPYFHGIKMNGIVTTGCDASSTHEMPTAPNASSYNSNFLAKCTFEYTAGSTTVCRKPGNLTVSDITAEGATFSWTARNEETEWVVYVDGEELETTSDNPYTIDGLSASSAHTFGVAAVCDEGQSGITTATFNTSCVMLTQEDLPITESVDNLNTDLANCWTKLNLYTTGSYPYPYPLTTFNHGNGSGKSLYFYVGDAGKANYAILPPVDDLSGLMLTFWSYIPSPTNVQMEVGTMTDPEDATTFTTLYTTPTTLTANTWVEHEVIVPEGTTAHYLAIRNGGSNYYTAYVDDITLMVAPECNHPASVSVTGITTTSATVAINDPSEVGNYVISLISANDTVSYTTTDLEYALSDLSPSSTYTVSVHSICDDGNPTSAVSTTFHTECGAVTTFPWTEGFEGTFTTGTNYSDQVDLLCWDIIHGSSTYSYTSISTTSHTGSQSMRFYPGSNLYVVAILPPMGDISGLELTLWAKAENASSSGSLQLGYITDVNDVSTFTPTCTIPGTDHTSTFVEEMTTFAGAPEGARIAIRQMSNASNYYWWVDDIDVHEAPACARPTITVSGITTDSAIVTLADPNATGAYKLVVNGATDTLDVTADPYELSGLNASSTYTLTAFTVCDDGSLSQPITVQFNTECADIAAPYTATFATTIPACWNNPNNMSISTGEQAIYTYSPDYRLISPAIQGDLSQIVVRVNQRGYYSSYYCQIGIGDANGNNVTWIGTTSATESYTDDIFFLNAYTGTERHLVIGGGNGYTYIRSIELEQGSGCMPVGGAVVSDVTSSTATLSWNASEDAAGYIVDYRQSGSTNWTTATEEATTDTSFTVTGLNSSTAYDLRVRVACTEDTSYSVILSATTLCEAEEFPWHFTQADMLAVQTPGFSNCWSWNTFWRTTTNGVGQVYSYGAGNEFRLPPVDVDLSTAQLRTLVATTATGAKFMVGVREGETTVWLDTIEATTTASTTDGLYYEISLANYTGTSNRVVVGNATGSYIYHLDFHIEPIATCPAVSNISTSSITSDGATISWAAGSDDQSQWLVSVDGGDYEPVSATTYTVTGLNANSDHTVEVRALCSEDDTSSARTASFRTSCGAITELPWTEDFTGLTTGYNNTIPCFDILFGVDGQWETNRTDRIYPVSTGNPNPGVTIYGAINSSNYGHGDGYLILPPFEVSGDVVFSYDAYLRGATTNHVISAGYMTDVTDGSTFVELGTPAATSPIDTWFRDSILVSGYDPDVHGRLALRYHYGVNNDWWFCYVDNLTVSYSTGEVPPTPPTPDPCDAPTAVNATVTESSVTLTWTATGDCQVALVSGNSWSEPAASSIVDVAAGTGSYTFDAQPATTYTVGVRQVCTESNSDWVTRTVTTDEQVGIDAVNATAAFELFPNPASGSVSIAGFEGQVTIVDLNGREVMTAQVGDTRASIDISSLPAGAYFVRLTSERQTAVRKLIVK